MHKLWNCKFGKTGGGFYYREGSGFTAEEEPSVSLQTPPCMAHFKCSLISSATTITGPRGKRKKQMEAGRGDPGEGEGDFKNREGVRLGGITIKTLDMLQT